MRAWSLPLGLALSDQQLRIPLSGPLSGYLGNEAIGDCIWEVVFSGFVLVF